MFSTNGQTEIIMYMEIQGTWYDQNNFKKENQCVERLTLFDFKISYKARVVKTVWCLCKNMQMYNWDRIESPEINP